jgi:acetoin utilization protein AcuB
MLVRDWMSKNVVSVGEDESMQRATAIMKERKVRMLPVVRKGKLVGVISDTDLKRASASDATTLDVHELLYLLSKIKVKDIMTKDPVTVPVDWTVEEVAEILLNHRISGMPVVDSNGEVAGIITRDDIFKVLISLSGLGKRGVQFAFQIEDRPGSIKDLTDIIRSHGGRIASILGSYEGVPAGYRMVYIRAFDIDRATLQQLQKELQEEAKLYYVVDHRENRREIFLDSPA